MRWLEITDIQVVYTLQNEAQQSKAKQSKPKNKDEEITKKKEKSRNVTV